METIYFATSNQGKVESLQNILREAGVTLNVEPTTTEYPEDRDASSTDEIARTGAEYCAAELSAPVLVTDTGIFIDSLNDFPGLATAFTLKRIGVQGILQLMEHAADRSVTWTLSLGYAAPGQKPNVFTSSLRGTIAHQERGSYGFGFDSIFIPEGYDVTLAEEEGARLRDVVSPFRLAIQDFAIWYARPR